MATEARKVLNLTQACNYSQELSNPLNIPSFLSSQIFHKRKEEPPPS